MDITKEKLTELLVAPGHITQEQLDAAFVQIGETKRGIVETISDMGIISDENLGRVIADGFGYKFVDLGTEKITPEGAAIIPEAVARSQQAVVYHLDEKTMYVATTHPENYEFLKLIEKKTGKQVDVAYATPRGITESFRAYKSDLRGRAQELVDRLKNDPRDENGIIELVNLILEYAYDNGTSDIHIEPLDESAEVRFRIDGILHQVVMYPKSLHETVVFRLKIMARLRTDEHAAMQDGRFAYENHDEKFDVRVSIVPTTEGENIVMRLLVSETNHQNRLEDLGYAPADANILRRAVEKPYGMILSVGPTGSGKSTTLYTLLQMLNKPNVNVMTIEDPVEYNMEHVRQIPVNVKKDVTFSSGLRSIVRQDPDIVMVGEIRDAETANIAVNAAMTGHLLLSTLHSNDAATTFPRLIDLGVEPFLVASSLNVVIAQRLVRRICNRCRESYMITDEERALVESNPEIKLKFDQLSGGRPVGEIRLYRGTGCGACNHTGYEGRVGIFEIFEMNPDLRTLITQKASADVIQSKAREAGMESMAADGVEKVFAGATTLAEVVRATKL